MAVFPLPILPRQNYHYGGISFRGTSKHRGDRIHAACDLVVPAGTPVFAVEKGTVLKVPRKAFHLGTYTITIKHQNFIIRYAEVAQTRFVNEFDEVAEGQQIGTVGRNNNGGAMLHFEMYSGAAEGSLSREINPSKYLHVKHGNFLRRKDLLDPTPYLDSWSIWLRAGDWIGDQIEKYF